EVNYRLAPESAPAPAPVATVWVKDAQHHLVPETLGQLRPVLTTGFFFHSPSHRLKSTGSFRGAMRCCAGFSMPTSSAFIWNPTCATLLNCAAATTWKSAARLKCAKLESPLPCRMVIQIGRATCTVRVDHYMTGVQTCALPISHSHRLKSTGSFRGAMRCCAGFSMPTSSAFIWNPTCATLLNCAAATTWKSAARLKCAKLESPLPCRMVI